MKILHVLNSDFGSPNTMGYRSYQIYKNSNNVNILCRLNKSKLKYQNIKIPFLFYQQYSRFVQLILKKLGNGKLYKITRNIELFTFEYFAKKEICNSDIIHFFHHDPNLIQYAKKLNKKTIVEAFTHPKYIKKMFNEGMILDSNEFDEHSISSYEIADYIISPSRWVTKTLKYSNLDPKKIIEIFYGVHTKKNKTYDTKAKTLKIVFAGGLKRTKGIIHLLEAVKLLSNLELEVYIYGRMYSNVKTEIANLSNNKIILKGFVQNMADEYQQYDIYIYPTYFEGSSKTVFEAMSAGLPIITTENSGSIVRDSLDGFIIPVNNSEIIAHKIKYFYENREQIAIMGRNAQVYSRNFTWEKYAKKVNDFYKRFEKYEN